MAPRGGTKSMDLLKAALAERQAKAQKITSESGQKWVRRGVLEEQRKEEYLEEKRREDEEQQAKEEERLEKFQEFLTKGKKGEEEAEEQKKKIKFDESLLDDDDAEPPIAMDQVIERLREVGSPITLFGETDMHRYKRLRNVEKEIHEGKRNPDLLMLEQHQHKLQREEQAMAEEIAESAGQFQSEAVAADDKSDSEDDDEEKGLKIQNEAGIEAEKPKDLADEEPVEVNSELMDRCDYIRSFIRKTMKAWEKDLAERPEETKQTAIVKGEIAHHRQARRDIRPLQKRLRMYRLEDFMLTKIHPIVDLAENKEYRQAAEAYLDLSIGKAAWPVGIGCGGSMLMEDAIGLHDRFNRMENVKDTAWALNDEVARKYVQALKRIISMAQKYWPPADPSKMAG